MPTLYIKCHYTLLSSFQKCFEILQNVTNLSNLPLRYVLLIKQNLYTWLFSYITNSIIPNDITKFVTENCDKFSKKRFSMFFIQMHFSFTTYFEVKVILQRLKTEPDRHRSDLS